MLVVDDEPDIRYLLRRVLERSDGKNRVVEEAANGAEALRVPTRLPNTSDATVIVLDQQMPGLNGLETAARIRAQRQDQPIILFSALLTDAIRQDAVRAGVTLCLPKTAVAELPTLVDALAG